MTTTTTATATPRATAPTRATPRATRRARATPRATTAMRPGATRTTTRTTTSRVATGATPLGDVADAETVMLTYGSIGVFVATIAFFVYRAFGSMMFGPTATASHVLVKDRAKAEALKAEIEADVAGGAPLRAKFARVAEQHSTCPSAKKGGELGTFKPGQMVKEFDNVVFTGEIGAVLGPVDTQFGSHLILITDREEAKK